MSRHFWYQSSAKSGHTYHFRTITFRISPTSSATTYYDCIPKKPRRLNRSLSTTTSKQRDQSTPIRDTVLLIDQTQEIITIAARRNPTACPILRLTVSRKIKAGRVMDKIQEFISIAAVLSYRFLWYDWSRQNQNKQAWPREDWNDTFLASFLVAAIS